MVSSFALNALFRNGQEWNAFVIENGRVRVLPVEAGRRNAFEVEIVKRLNEGMEVVLHPANDLNGGARVTVRGN